MIGKPSHGSLILIGIILLLVLLAISFFWPNVSNKDLNLGESVVLGSLGKNIAMNPSFEEGEQSKQAWEPVIWQGSATFLWIDLADNSLDNEFNVPNNVRTGNRSLMIQSSSSDVLCAWRSKEVIDVKPGFSYFAAVWAKIDYVGSKGVHLGVAWFNQQGEWITVSSSEIVHQRTEGWIEISLTSVAPENAVKGSIELHLDDEGLVFFDDVSLKESIPGYYAFDDWVIMDGNLPTATVTIQNSTLTAEAQFESTADEFIICQRRMIVDTISQPYLTLSWRTSTNQPGDPGIFVEFVTASGKSYIQPLGFSEEWTTSTININVFTKGEGITDVRFMLNDWNDNVSSGTFSVQVRGLYLSSSVLNLKSVFLLVVASGTFVFALIDSYKRASKLNKALLVASNLAFLSALPPLVVPFYRLPFLEIVTLAFIGISFVLILAKYKIKATETVEANNSRTTKQVVLIIGLLTIPLLTFLIRLNYANLPTLFSDETSYGIMSWGLLNGKLVGLNLPGPWLNNVPNFFKIEQYPANLALPYTMDWMQSLSIVSPFMLPFLCPLISAPVIAFFGFSAVTIRFAYVLMSTVSVVFVFLIGRHFSNRIGLIGAGFMAFTAYAVNFGSKAFMDNGVLLFFVITIFSFLKFKETENHRYLYLAAIAAGLCTLTKIGFGFLALGFLILALFFDSRKKRDAARIMPISLGIFLVMIIGYLLINYQGLIWSFSYYSGYVSSLALQGQAWMTQPLLILNYPELVLGLVCLAYVLIDKGDFTKLLLLLLLSSIPLIILAKPMWLLPILPLLSLGVGKALAYGSEKGSVVLKSLFLLIFAYIATKELSIVSELFILFFAMFLVFAIISQFTTSHKFDFFKKYHRFDMIWTTFIIILFAVLYIQNTLLMPLA